MLTVLCVWTGDKYGAEYVTRLRNMVARHLPIPHRFVCFTDRPEADRPEGVEYVDVTRTGLTGWWAKFATFVPLWEGRRLYFDLDTVIVDDLTPLAEWSGEFGICENFTRLAGHPTWSCRYGSCVMSFAAGFGWRVWDELQCYNITSCKHGDQEAIERVYPNAGFLQRDLPPRYFLGYRDLTDRKPDGCAIVVFAGSSKPHTCEHQWIREAWV